MNSSCLEECLVLVRVQRMRSACLCFSCEELNQARWAQWNNLRKMIESDHLVTWAQILFSFLLGFPTVKSRLMSVSFETPHFSIGRYWLSIYTLASTYYKLCVRLYSEWI